MLYEPALLAIASKTIVLGIHYSTSLWMLPASIAIYYGYGALQGLPQAISSHIAAIETSWLDSATSYSTQMALNRKKRTVHLIYPFQRLLCISKVGRIHGATKICCPASPQTYIAIYATNNALYYIN
jgi:hypothetical protein